MWLGYIQDTCVQTPHITTKQKFVLKHIVHTYGCVCNATTTTTNGDLSAFFTDRNAFQCNNVQRECNHCDLLRHKMGYIRCAGHRAPVVDLGFPFSPFWQYCGSRALRAADSLVISTPAKHALHWALQLHRFQCAVQTKTSYLKVIIVLKGSNGSLYDV